MHIEKGDDDITDTSAIRIDGDGKNVIRPAAIVTYAHWSWNKVRRGDRIGAGIEDIGKMRE
jgi:hypothetical protein